MIEKELVSVGKYKGKPWSQVPKSYLEYVANIDSMLSEDCREELKRRNSNIDDFKMLPSVIDSASFCCLKEYMHNISVGEVNIGFNAYMKAMCKNALELGKQDNSSIHYKDLIFLVQWGNLYPVFIGVKHNPSISS